MVEDMSDDDSSTDRITEEGGEDGDVEGGEDGDVEGDGGVEKEAEISELDSDDLSQPEMAYGQTDRGPVRIGRFVAQNLGPDAIPTASKVIGTQKSNKEGKKFTSESSSSEGEAVINDNRGDHLAIPVNCVNQQPAHNHKKTSILLNADEKSPINEDEITKVTEPSKVVLPGSKEAFSGIIKERNVEVFTASDVPAAITQPSTSKPQSLFRMKRLHNNM
ncbi:hypothetical protein COOONC_25047 [Cooperia oncophora]